MEPGVILVATLVTEPHDRQEGLPQRLDLRCRQGIDALSNSHDPPNCGAARSAYPVRRFTIVRRFGLGGAGWCGTHAARAGMFE
jgi:hypothetical protein